MDALKLTKRQRYDQLKAGLDADYKTFERQFQDLNDYFLPTRGRFVLSSDSNRGDRRNLKLLDAHPAHAARTLAAGMQGGITPPSRNWKRLSTPDPDLAEFGPVREWTEVVDSRMSTLFTRSNLYNILPLAYGDTGVFATGAIFMDKDFDTVFRFQSFPLGSYRIATDENGKVNTFLREFRMTVRQLIGKFWIKEESDAENWKRFSDNVKRLYVQAQYDAWIDVTHVIEPNELYEPGNPFNKRKKFSSCYFESGSQDSRAVDERYLRESGYDYFPVLVPRWQVTGGDAWGTESPGMMAIGDAKELQHRRKKIARALDKMIDPPLKGAATLKGQRVSLVSGDISYLEDPNDRLEPVHQVNFGLNEWRLEQQELRRSVDKSFFVDLFMQFTESDRRQITAEEIRERKQEKLLALGPVLEQLNQDLLDPLIENAFLLMNEAGLIPEAPEELQGQALKVEYISIMAQAQKLAGIESMDRILNVATAVINLDPRARHKFDAMEYLDQYADKLGTSSKVIRTDERVQELLAQEEAAAAAQQRMQMATDMSKMAKDLGSTDLSKDSALSRLADQAKAGELVPQ